MITLSIVVPTFNRGSNLARLLETVSEPAPNIALEIVIVDDGSVDDTFNRVKNWKNIHASSSLTVIYLKQENQGRGPALINGLKHASGAYVILMDSDDEFLPGWQVSVQRALDIIERYGNAGEIRPLVGAVFHCEDDRGEIIGSPFPQGIVSTNLLKLRADFSVKGDKKEIVRRDVLTAAAEMAANGEKRLPTALLWALAANRGDCLVIGERIVKKVYLASGMSRNLTRLKYESPKSMCDYNYTLLNSDCFNSKMFRFRAAVQYVRYSIISGRSIRFSSIQVFTAWIPGFILAKADDLRLKVPRKRSIPAGKDAESH